MEKLLRIQFIDKETGEIIYISKPIPHLETYKDLSKRRIVDAIDSYFRGLSQNKVLTFIVDCEYRKTLKQLDIF